MIISFRSFASVTLTGALTLGISVSDVHAQRRGMAMQHGMMSFRPNPLMARPMGFQPNPFMVRPTPSRPNPVVRPMQPRNPSRINRDRFRDRIERERRQWWRNRWWWNNGYLGNYSGLYGLGYGGYDLSGYGNGYTPSYQRSDRSDRVYQPPSEESRPQSAQERFERLVSNPTTGEVVSGQALNAVLTDLRALVAEAGTDNLPATALAMSDEAMAHVNFSQGAGNIALLKRDGRLSWPAAFSGPEDEELRVQLTAEAHAVVLQAQKERRVDSGRVAQMARGVEQLKKELPRIARNQAPDTYVEAKTFVKNLDDAVVALQQPDAINHFNGEYALKAKTVPELVRWMTDKGLQFAPAIPGDDVAYTTLHRTLAAYDKAARTPKGSSVPTATATHGFLIP